MIDYLLADRLLCVCCVCCAFMCVGWVYSSSEKQQYLSYIALFLMCHEREKAGPVSGFCCPLFLAHARCVCPYVAPLKKFSFCCCVNVHILKDRVASPSTGMGINQWVYTDTRYTHAGGTHVPGAYMQTDRQADRRACIHIHTCMRILHFSRLQGTSILQPVVTLLRNISMIVAELVLPEFVRQS